MRKVLLIISIFLCFLFMTKVEALQKSLSDEFELYLEQTNIIEFDNLHSSKINEVLEGIDGTVIEFEIQIKNIIKVYRVNTKINNDIEKELNNKVLKALEEDGLRELGVVASIKGYKINKMKIRCSKKVLETVKKRSENV